MLRRSLAKGISVWCLGRTTLRSKAVEPNLNMLLLGVFHGSENDAVALTKHCSSVVLNRRPLGNTLPAVREV